MSALNLLYQFWVHTEAIGKLGPLEWILNTPSHHRVHHARNPQYLDKNYAGMFIIWDRMFGTFEPEVEEPVYGITKPLQSWNPLWANFHAWAELAHDAWAAPRWQDKIKIWFMPLGWTPPGLPEGPRAGRVTRATVTKFNPRLPLGLNLYVLLHFVLTLVVSVNVLTMSDQDAPLGAIVAPAALVLWSLASLGGVLERKRWAMFSEVVRQAAIVAMAAVWFTESEWQTAALAAAVALAAVSVVWVAGYRRDFGAAETANWSVNAVENGRHAAQSVGSSRLTIRESRDNKVI
jgi:hypothetical protein